MSVTGPETRENAVVSFTVKDLLTDLSRNMTDGFARLTEAMAGKADKADLAEIKGTLSKHETLIEGLQRRQDLDDNARTTAAQIKDNRTQSRRWLWPVVISALTVAVLVLSTILTLK